MMMVMMIMSIMMMMMMMMIGTTILNKGKLTIVCHIVGLQRQKQQLTFPYQSLRTLFVFFVVIDGIRAAVPRSRTEICVLEE